MKKDDIENIKKHAIRLFDHQEVDHALDRMAADITRTLGNSLPVVLCVLSGSIVPAGHLLTRLAFPLVVDYLHATRYQGATTGKAVKWLCKPVTPLQGREVLIIDDILDEGYTLQAVMDFCHQQGATRVCSAVLVEKQHPRRLDGVTADFVGLSVEDRYVFGFGMDYRGYMRNLDGIYALGPGFD